MRKPRTALPPDTEGIPLVDECLAGVLIEANGADHAGVALKADAVSVEETLLLDGYVEPLDLRPAPI